ncbi:MAG: trypsin-like peptidase domain-containing protein [Candidatus Aminicenantes bacterium]|nr:trypsin-like peptidase domain-containing protein [Candidatus Aminicenantes bacterium]
MKKVFLVLLVFSLVTLFFSNSLPAKIKVGEEVIERTATPHPYNSRMIWEQVFHWPQAGYIAIHFSRFDLAPGDYVEISNAAGTISYTYKGKGKVVRGGKKVISEFWATHIPDDTVIVTLHSKNTKGGWGFEIDKWVHGYERHAIEQSLFTLENTGDADIESICGTDDKQWAKCYEGTTMYDEARAVCRLLMNGSSACTGWLVGSEGHVMTNNHCIESQSTADNTDFEFMAEGALCTTNCTGWLACPGTIEADHGTLIKTDTSLDYTLVRLPTNISSTYGYLQLRSTLPIIDERIYIPQHPGAYGKQLAVVSTDSHDQSGYCEIYSTNETPCMAGPGDIGYFADTAGGSSGSPVLAYSDHLVVSLHHCAACPNRGLPIPAIITSLGALIPANAIGGGTVNPPAAPSNLAANASTCNKIDLTWTDNSDNESSFKIERSTNGVNFSEIASVGANVTSFSDTTAAENTTYWYRVRAYNSGGYSGYSNTVSATTPVCPPAPPAAPTNLAATPGKTTVTLTWTDNSNNETGFRIYRGTSPSALNLINTVGANTTSYLDSGLARRATYYYKVCAYNAYGESCSATIQTKTK